MTCHGCGEKIEGAYCHVNSLGVDYYFHLDRKIDCFIRWIKRRAKDEKGE